MSAYTIYVFVVTGLYILTVSVIFLLDVFGKKSVKEEHAEEFNNSDMNDGEERSHVVAETDGGYAIKSQEEAAAEMLAAEQVETEDSTVENLSDDENLDENLLDNEAMESQEYVERMDALENNMETVPVEFDESYSTAAFAALCANPLQNGVSFKIIPENA